MSDLFSVIAHEDANDQAKVRQATALAVQRVNDRFAAFVRQGSVDDQAARFSLVEDDIKAVVAAACAQVGYDGSDGLYKSIANNFVTAEAAPQLRTASIRAEARKPKMCGYHSEVTDISLAAGDPSAGYNAMASHAWSGNHCQGGDYEGGKCNFKPAMTTQSFWDDKAAQREERKLEREEQLQNQDATENVTELPEFGPDNDSEVVDDVSHDEPSAIGDGIEEAPQAIEEAPVLVEASVKTADDGLGGNGTAVPKMDKRKWTPKTVPALKGVDDPKGKNPSEHKDVIKPIHTELSDPNTPSDLKEIGEATTERVDVTKGSELSHAGQGGTFGGGDRSAVSKLISTASVNEALSKFKRA